MSEQCVFCDIVAGRAPAQIVRRWPETTAFVPLDPVTPGHLLIVPNEHVRDAVEKPNLTMLTMGRAVSMAAESDSANILTSIGAPATQSIFHLHIHVVPRATGDMLMVPWGTTGDPHAPHWCKVAERLQRELDEFNHIRSGVLTP
jgi:histidine triad (HIT) family protein